MGPGAQGAYNAGNNRINGQGYDAAGNQLSSNGDALGYDAENRIAAVTEPPSLVAGPSIPPTMATAGA
jgi:hypothetical protein